MHVDIKTLDKEEAPFYVVYLNGSVVRMCYAANEEDGWVDCFSEKEFEKADYDPEKVLDCRERFFGSVKIVNMKEEQEKAEANKKAGMVYNPYSDKWSFL